MSEASRIFALKITASTCKGTREGVPRLMELLGRFGIRATFYFPMGPDNSGKIIRRIFRKGYLRGLFRTGTLSAYGLRTMLYGIILPPPYIAEKVPEVMLEAEKAGHETGIHSWDHVKWHDYLPWLPKQAALMELGRASAAYEEIFGRRSRTTAAPGWTVTADSLEIQDAMRLSYCSDSFGVCPFYPVMEGRKFNTLQVPTTWPTLDGIVGVNGFTPAAANDLYLSLLQPGLNVHTIQAELEGTLYIALFASLVERLSSSGVRFVTLGEAASEYADRAPNCELRMVYRDGHAMPVAVQVGE